MPPEYEIFFADTSKQNLEFIRRYYIFELEDFLGWTKIFSGIISRCYALRIFPTGNPRVGIIDGKIIRKTRWNKYLIYYLVDKKLRKVIILNIIDAHRRYRPF